MQTTQAYIILGTPGSGRRAILADLIAECFGAEDAVSCLLCDTELASEHDARLGTLARWTWTTDKEIKAELPEGTRTLFFITNGRANPIDQLEFLRDWMRSKHIELARVLCVIDSALIHANPGAMPWLDACIHFSDVALLNRREGVPNKWMSDLIGRYEDLCLPCLFELVRKDKVRNPAAVLDPVARRISQAFDEVEEKTAHNFEHSLITEDTVFIDDCEGEDDDDAKLDGGESPEDDEDDTPEEDTYFLRKPGGGRVRTIPDITKFLPPLS